jgi:hypothetical protein
LFKSLRLKKFFGGPTIATLLKIFLDLDSKIVFVLPTTLHNSIHLPAHLLPIRITTSNTIHLHMKELLNFVRGKTFEQLKAQLSVDPYRVAAHHDGKLYTLYYDLIKSDMNLPIV